MPLTPFKEALQKLQAKLPVALRERAFFSARVANAQHLQEIKDRVESILNPKIVMREGG
jgi:hypothetical protein